MKIKVIITSNTAWSLVNFRLGLIKALIRKGYEVITIAPKDGYESKLIKLGCKHINIAINSRGMNPLEDLLLVWKFFKIIKDEGPDVLLTFTIKPNIYGSIAAKPFQVVVINNITGLGDAFSKKNWLKSLIMSLYRFSLLKSYKVFFQNSDDQNLFIKKKIVRKICSDRLPGSGIDISKFVPHKFQERSYIHFLFIGRLIRSKGVYEFIEAAKILKQKNIKVKFFVLGPFSHIKQEAVEKVELNNWINKGLIKYLGFSNDVRKHIKNADCVVLPSYYNEGVPRSLLEASAMGRPIITTNSVGCREVIENNVNGFVCRAKDSNDLANQLIKFTKISVKEKKLLGMQGRYKIEDQFDEDIVINKYLSSIKMYINK
jgi:glycosyltransferase involved in cell wall biosynthesis